ncbi:MAG: 2-amino-4-hydroxy-6-hydroxymethyldihydropteridine diphosphokinase [Kiritimatiellae bacterium]|nr:2-amino-4-hydroxy-6-hydroxymethyldihydropteridine diphosphokinase [Kiritimatiellia bacterium]
MNGIEAGFSIGSNLGDRAEWLRKAREAIAAIPGVSLRECAPLYETEPVGCAEEFSEQLYLNSFLVVGTELEVHRLFAETQRIETELGRKRLFGRRNTPRTVDIDLIYYDGQTVRSGGLVVPHPRWSRRRFVLQPMCDVRPAAVLPGHDRSVREILAALPEGGQTVRLVAKIW